MLYEIIYLTREWEHKLGEAAALLGTVHLTLTCPVTGCHHVSRVPSHVRLLSAQLN